MNYIEQTKGNFELDPLDKYLYAELERHKNISMLWASRKYWRTLKDIALSFCKLERLGVCFIKGNIGSNIHRDITQFDLDILKDLSNYKYLMIGGLAKKHNKPIEDIALSLAKLERKGLCSLKAHYKPESGELNIKALNSEDLQRNIESLEKPKN